MEQKRVYRAYAKVNLALDILGKRDDGFHEMDMVMQSISLYDTLQFRPVAEEGVFLSSSKKGLPLGQRNIVWKAANALLGAVGKKGLGVHIEIHKYIPSQAGLGGGSADGAAALMALNELWGFGLSVQELCQIGATVGADIPFCLVGGTKRVQGMGEKLISLPELPHFYFVLCKPEDFGVDTKAAFAQFDSVGCGLRPDIPAMVSAIGEEKEEAVASLLCNVMEGAAQSPVIGQLKEALLARGALGSAMTGSGSAVFGLFTEREAAKAAIRTIRRGCPFCYLYENSPVGVEKISIS